MDQSILLIPLLVLFVIGARFTTVFVHELGHGLAVALMSRGKASLYIGSFGDKTKSLKINLGILILYIKYNPFLWQKGLCVPHSRNLSINQQILYTVMGPVASLLVLVAACILAFVFRDNELVKMSCMVVVASAFLDFYGSATPRITLIKTYGGQTVQNDAQQIKNLWPLRKLPNEYKQASELFDKKNYAEAAELFAVMQRENPATQHLCRMALASFIQLKAYEKGREFADKLVAYTNVTSDDYVNAGLLYFELENNEKAFELYSKSLALNPDNIYTLNNRGYLFIIQNRFAESIALFDKAIHIDKTFVYPYVNRGLSKIKTGDLEGGLADVQHALTLDPNSAYAHCNLGIYHKEKGENEEALHLFKKAKELDNDVRGIDTLIAEVEEKT
ncbi:MAG TPA: tetratricopeptide repeat protein [Flavobacteriales bacterium]|nr:tetratricopeptide repeat protein [Flavobacteriales bacterium]